MCLDVFCREAPVLCMCVCVRVGTNQRSDVVIEVCSHAASMGAVALVKNITSLWSFRISLDIL